ncbi:MAG: hypothetical protein D8M61_16575 [Ignavibacteriae bacterium]|nr:hypothetical protein [Ignavibacteriota bacterium]
MVIRHNAIRIFLSLILIYGTQLSIDAQDIEANLAKVDSSSGFTVKDSLGNTVLTARGNGNVGVGKINSNYLFEVGSFLDLDDQFGRSIKIATESNISNGNAGDLILSTGSIGPIYYAEGASINISGASEFGIAGGIELVSGKGEDHGGDILLETGGTTSDGWRTGNISLITADTDNNIAGNVEITCGYGGIEGGSISLNAGNSDVVPGNITLSPGNDLSSSNDGIVEVNGSGIVSGDWTVSSDKRLKKNIKSLVSSSDKIMKLRPVIYEMRKDEYPERNLPKGRQIGLIAQEVEVLFPEIVRTDSEGFKSINYSKLSVLLIDVTKKQNKKIKNLESEINEIKEMIQAQNTLIQEVSEKINQNDSVIKSTSL